LLVAMTLAATPAQAQCTVGDIKMTQFYPFSGENLTRGSDVLTNNVMIDFTLPEDCDPADPPLTACVDVWDTGDPKKFPNINPHVGSWMKGSPPMLCNSNFLADNSGTVIKNIRLAIDFVGSRSGLEPDYLILTMHNPTRYLKIPID